MNIKYLIILSSMFLSSCLCNYCKPKEVIVIKVRVQYRYPEVGVSLPRLPIEYLDKEYGVGEPDNIGVWLRNANNTVSSLDMCYDKLNRIDKEILKIKKEEEDAQKQGQSSTNQ